MQYAIEFNSNSQGSVETYLG